jgi:hypothetical protein
MANIPRLRLFLDIPQIPEGPNCYYKLVTNVIRTVKINALLYPCYTTAVSQSDFRARTTQFIIWLFLLAWLPQWCYWRTVLVIPESRAAGLISRCVCTGANSLLLGGLYILDWWRFPLLKGWPLEMRNEHDSSPRRPSTICIWIHFKMVLLFSRYQQIPWPNMHFTV